MTKNKPNSRHAIRLMVGSIILFVLTVVAFSLAGSTGNYRILSGRPPSYNYSDMAKTTHILGDLNGDRIVNLSDAIFGLRFLVQWNVDSATALQMSSADVNSDRHPGLAEVIFILQKEAGLRGCYLAVSCGLEHTMAVYGDGTVRTWGRNNIGQLGDGANSMLLDRNLPGTVNDLNNMIAVAAGGEHSLALRKDGTISAWGYNYDGQLGDGTTSQNKHDEENKYAPVSVGGVENVAAIAAGYYHSVALKSDGTVWTWGYNEFGQLGIGTDDINRTSGDGAAADKFVPTRVTNARFPDGSIGSLPVIIALAAGYYHTVALTEDGKVFCWGLNDDGQLGNGAQLKSPGEFSAGPPLYSNIPVQVVTGKNPEDGSSVELSGIVSIAAGGYHTVALKNDGTVWAWGYNEQGQLGNGTDGTDNQDDHFHRVIPTQVIAKKFDGTSEGLSNIVAIAAGFKQTVALDRFGFVWTWGDNKYGQLGDGSNTNRNSSWKISSLSNMVAVASGCYHMAALRRDGTIWAWGDNMYGQLGNGTNTAGNLPSQVSAP
jgi:alpha-tubulin suppressor-like RCC1 family protein